MDFVRKVTDSDILLEVIDLPQNLRHKKVEILIFPYEELVEDKKQKPKKARGLLRKYKNKDLSKLEDNAWEKAVKDKYENS